MVITGLCPCSNCTFRVLYLCCLLFVCLTLTPAGPSDESVQNVDSVPAGVQRSLQPTGAESSDGERDKMLTAVLPETAIKPEERDF